jgi:hypothetical protein
MLAVHEQVDIEHFECVIIVLHEYHHDSQSVPHISLACTNTLTSVMKVGMSLRSLCMPECCIPQHN